jgi:hypothetical protein
MITLNIEVEELPEILYLAHHTAIKGPNTAAVWWEDLTEEQRREWRTMAIRLTSLYGEKR